MSTATASPVNDIAELQNVLTRYVDSLHGYQQAAEVIGTPNIAAAFLEIAARREVIVRSVSHMIRNQGGKPDVDGSPEAALHRWWMRLRIEMSDEELEAALSECVRGERELERTIDGALEKGECEPSHTAILSEMADELRAAIQTFETALGR